MTKYTYVDVFGIGCQGDDGLFGDWPMGGLTENLSVYQVFERNETNREWLKLSRPTSSNELIGLTKLVGPVIDPIRGLETEPVRTIARSLMDGIGDEPVVGTFKIGG